MPSPYYVLDLPALPIQHSDHAASKESQAPPAIAAPPKRLATRNSTATNTFRSATLHYYLGIQVSPELGEVRGGEGEGDQTWWYCR